MPRRSSPGPLAGPAVDEQAALPGRRERAKQAKRERLVRAARELFAEKGFAETTTSEIARRADVGTGTLFLYVQSKEELLVLVFQEDMSRVRDEAFATLPRRASFLDEIFHVYRMMAEYHERDRTLARVYAKEVAFVRAPNRAGVQDFMERLLALSSARIAAATARGELAGDLPARGLSLNLFATFFLWLQHALGTDLPLTAPAYLAQLREGLALQLRGLGPSAATTPTTPTTAAGRSARRRPHGGDA